MGNSRESHEQSLATMSPLVSVFLLLLVPTIFAKECGVRPTSKIVGGEDAYENEFPWQVSWRFYNTSTNKHRHVCGGSILSDDWLISAAHCVDLFKDVSLIKPQNFRAQLGSHRQSLPSANEKIMEVEEIHIHPNWNYDQIINDVAVIKLKEKIGLENSALNAICLGSPNDNIEGGPAIISGWGLTEHGGSSIPDTLQRADVTIEKQSDCKSIYSFVKPLTDGEICAGKAKSGCNGDSGGPLQYKKGERFYLAGAASWVVRCGSSIFPTVFARVPYFLDFITSTTGVSAHN